MQTMQQRNPSKIFLHILRLLALYVGLLLLLLIFSSALTYVSLKQASNYQLSQAAASAKTAKRSLGLANILSLNQSATLRAWKESLLIVEESPSLQTQLQQSLTALTNSENLLIDPQVIESLNRINRSLQNLNTAANQSRLIKQTVGTSRLKQLEAVTHQLPIVIQLAEQISSQDLNWTLLLKNNEELRAGGGFIGSIASFSTHSGQITEPTFYDVYDLSNRVERLTQPPVGVGKYLSEDKGFALTDANWEADFTQAAPTILSFINQSELPKTDLLVAINLSLIQDLLKVTGPVKLIDSDQEVTAQNVSHLARQDRLNFFAGDKQKKLFLNQLYQSLKHELPNLDNSQQLKLMGLIFTSVKQKQIMLYSVNPETQLLLLELDAAGAINHPTDFFLYLPESNVGINKANQGISRSISASIQPELLTIDLTFFNDNLPLSEIEKQAIQDNPDLNQADHLGYINYQRLITDFPFDQIKISCNETEIDPEEMTQIKTQGGTAFQTGFLLTVAEQNSTKCKISLIPKTAINSDQTWTIIKQPGLPLTDYHLYFFEEELKFTLSQDISIGQTDL